MDPNENKVHLSSQDFKALSAANRIQILKLLKQQNRNPTELAAKLSISIPSCQKHLDKLVESDLVARIEDNRKWAYYRLTPKGLALVEPENSRFLLLLAAGIVLVFGAFLVWNSVSEWNKPQIVLNPPVYDAETKTVQLSWTVSGHLVDGLFEVQRKIISEKEFKTLQSGIKATTHWDSQIQPNEHYEYRIVARGIVAGIGSVQAISNSSFVITTQSPKNKEPALPEDENNLLSPPPDSNAPSDHNNPIPPPSPLIPIPSNVQLFFIPTDTTHWEQTIGEGLGAKNLVLEKTRHPAVVITWAAPENEGLLFEVQVRTNQQDWQTLAADLQETVFLDSLVEIGETRSYRVRSWKNGVPSEFSAIYVITVS